MKLIRDNRGNVAVMMAFCAAVLLGVGGIALDYHRWSVQRTALQEAADSGALAGVIELGLGGRNLVQRVESKAARMATENLPPSLSMLTPAIIVDENAETVSVSFSAPARKSISATLIRSASVVSGAATAQVVNRVVACIYALNPAAPKAIDGNGSAILQGTNCAIQVNSSDVNALTNSGTISASHICVTGNYSGSGFTPTPEAGCEPLADPFAETAVPAPGACTFTNFSVNVSSTLSPGVYCGGLRVSGANVTATLNPGRYFIVDGPLKVLNGGGIVGAEVAFVLSGTASVDIGGNGVIATTPEISGDLAGFSVLQDRNAPLGGVSKITGEGRFEFPGIIYLPRQALDIAGRASGNTYTPTYAAIVADTIKISGQGELNATADTTNFGKKAASALTVVNAKLIK